MFRGGWIIFRIIGTLLLIGFLIAGGVMLYHTGQAQGYAAGLAAAGQEQTAPAPSNGLWPYYNFGWGYPFFFPFAPLIGFFVMGGFLFLIFGILGAIFRRRALAHGAGGYGPWPGSPRQGYPWGPPPWAGQPQPPAPGEPAPPSGQPPSEPPE
jgi:hypothetical protein